MNHTTVIEEPKLRGPQQSHGPNRQRATSDEEIAKAAQGRFHASPYFALRSIIVECREGVIVLRGEVASYFYKQMAQETVRRIAGIRLIINVVKVIQF